MGFVDDYMKGKFKKAIRHAKSSGEKEEEEKLRGLLSEFRRVRKETKDN